LNRPPVRLEAADGALVKVTDRAMFDADPALLRWGSRQWRLTGWAGPWPVDERWWAPDSDDTEFTARAQVQLDDAPAADKVLLLVYHDETWRAEGLYD
jgi:protein ImuB